MKKIKRRISRVLGGGGEEKPPQKPDGEQWREENRAQQLQLDKRDWDRSREEMSSRLCNGQSEFFPGVEFQLRPPRDPHMEAVKAKNKYRWSLSDSLSQLGERIAEMTVEEEGTARAGAQTGRGANGHFGAMHGKLKKETRFCPSASEAGPSSADPEKPVVLLRNKNKQRQFNNARTKSWHASRWFGNFGGHNHHNSASNATGKLGSDGESAAEVSPSGSEQHSSSSCSTGSQTNGSSTEYVPNVKMRQKAVGSRRWSEEEIQKRLSLPAYINIPQSVVEKLNRGGAPELENPISRKSRRASLSEIGFGKLETYKKIFDLGQGTYATVFLGQSLLTGKNVALKEIRLEHEEGAPCTAIREVSLLRNLKHANIVTLHDVVHTDSVLTLVFEFVEQDLREYMEDLEGPISVANVRLFLFQLLRGLAYCHVRRILHRDLKPQNLLITRNGELKLADFGLARAQSLPTKTYSSEVVTLWYRPPDVLMGSTDYTAHIDMWAVGCILYEMLAHRPMFPGSTPNEQLNLIFQKLGTPSAESHPELRELPGFKKYRNNRIYSPKSLLYNPRLTEERVDLLMKLLKYDGKQRISAARAMRHPFLRCLPESVFHLPDTESIYSLPNVHFVPDKKCLVSLAQTKGLTPSERLLLAEVIAAGSK